MKDDKRYNYSHTGIYYSPAELSLDEVKDYIRSFPLEDDPDVFGLNINANITLNYKLVQLK